MFVEHDGQRRSGSKSVTLRPLPPARVSTTVHVQYFSGYLICLCQEKDSIDNVSYLYDFSHWLERLEDFLGILLTHW